MDYRNILSQNVDGFLDHIMITGNVGLVQQIDRIQDDLEIGRLNGVQHFSGPMYVIHDMTDDRFDGNDHSHVLRILHYPVQISGKGGQRFLRPAVWIDRVLLVGSSCLRTHHTGSQLGSKTDLRLIGCNGLLQLFLIGICQVQITAQHRDVQIVRRKQLPQIHGKARCERAVRDRKILDHLSQRHMRTGKALCPRFSQPLGQRLYLCVMQTNSYLHFFLHSCLKKEGHPYANILLFSCQASLSHHPDSGVIHCFYFILFILLPQAFWSHRLPEKSPHVRSSSVRRSSAADRCC